MLTFFFRLVDFVDRSDLGMIEGGCSLRLSDEKRSLFLIGERLSVKKSMLTIKLAFVIWKAIGSV